MFWAFGRGHFLFVVGPIAVSLGYDSDWASETSDLPCVCITPPVRSRVIGNTQPRKIPKRWKLVADFQAKEAPDDRTGSTNRSKPNETGLRRSRGAKVMVIESIVILAEKKNGTCVSLLLVNPPTK